MCAGEETLDGLVCNLKEQIRSSNYLSENPPKGESIFLSEEQLEAGKSRLLSLHFA